MSGNYVEYWDDQTNSSSFANKLNPLPVNGSVAVQGESNVNFIATTSGSEVMASGQPLQYRHTVIIVNDSSDMISISLGDNDTFANSLKLFSGQLVQVTVDPLQYVPIYVRAPFYNVSIAVSEVRGVI